MQLNLFTWIREGVRQSVLLGVSDAIEALGTPAGEDTFRPNLARLIDSAPAEAAAAIGEGKRKRLGRSLKDFGDAS